MEISDIPKYALGAKLHKGELLRLMKMLGQDAGSPGGAGKLPSAVTGKMARLTRQSRITRDLLRRHFVLRIAQACENAA